MNHWNFYVNWLIYRQGVVNDKSSVQNHGQFCTILEDTDVREISSYPAIYFLGGAVSVATCHRHRHAEQTQKTIVVCYGLTTTIYSPPPPKRWMHGKCGKMRMSTLCCRHT